MCIYARLYLYFVLSGVCFTKENIIVSGNSDFTSVLFYCKSKLPEIDCYKFLHLSWQRGCRDVQKFIAIIMTCDWITTEEYFTDFESEVKKKIVKLIHDGYMKSS